jgi:endonuclease G
VVVHEKRKFALITAVNIDGRRLKKIVRKDTWRQDARIDAVYQPDDEFYVKSKATEKVYFSRGHLVRLLDPCWGTQAEANQGMQDTFHFTNAAPQFQSYNDSDWGDLEDYILEKAQGTQKRVTVFTGPLYLDDDPIYGRDREGGPWQIPLTFWKVAVLQKTNNTISAAAFIVGQAEYVSALYEAKVFTGLNPYTVEEMRERRIQISIEGLQKTIADGSALDFSMLIPYDAQGSLESTRQTTWLRTINDINI